MKTIKAITCIIPMTILGLLSFGQKSITTKELDNIAGKYGVDSALKIISPRGVFMDISRIDSTVAKSITLKCSDMRFHSRQLDYFMQMGQVFKDDSIKSKTLNHLKYYRSMSPDLGKSMDIGIIPDQIFHVLIFQNDPSIIPILKTEFDYWKHTADSLKNTFTKGVKKFFQGTGASGIYFNICQENSYKIAWTLNKFGESEFPAERVNSILQQIIPSKLNYDMEKTKFRPYELMADTVQLGKICSSIEEVDFDNEIEVVKKTGYTKNENCQQQIITNGKYGLCSVDHMPLVRGGGSGKIMLVELTNQYTLKMVAIGGWRG